MFIKLKDNDNKIIIIKKNEIAGIEIQPQYKNVMINVEINMLSGKTFQLAFAADKTVVEIEKYIMEKLLINW